MADSRWLPALILLACCGSTLANDTDLHYRLRFSEASSHYLHVELRITENSDSLIELMMPVWTPGSYLVREYARHIDSISAADGSGKPLSIDKVRKNRWSVDTNGAETVVVRYRLYCREMSVRTNWVEENFAILNGAPTFLTVAGGENRRHVVQVILPDRWKKAVSPLPTAEGRNDTFVAANFDELVDSPLLAGNPQVASFEVGGRTHQLVNQNGGEYWDVNKAAEDVKRIVAEHQRMWGVVPYPRYVFFNVISESGGGLEHDNSCLMMTSRWRFRIEKDYKRWLTLVSHEFFHTWNVRRLRPRGLRRYDYESENYTDSLWIAEGITSYYESLLMARCGLLTQSEYLDSLSSDIDGVEKTPGTRVQSLTESSRDTWIKFYRPDENSRNTRVSYYSKGAVAGFLLDAEIRRATDNQKSLDDVMRIMYERFADEGYLPEDFRSVTAEVAGKNLDDWFTKSIDRAEPLEYDRALDWLGLTFGDPAAQAEKAEDSEEKKKPWTGFSGSGESVVVVSRVESGSPAAKAGLNVGDEVLAIDGYRITGRSLSSRLRQYKVGDSIDLLTARRQEVASRKLTLAAEPRTLKLKVLKKPTEEQTRSLKSWLQLPEKKADKPTN